MALQTKRIQMALHTMPLQESKLSHGNPNDPPFNGVIWMICGFARSDMGPTETAPPVLGLPADRGPNRLGSRVSGEAVSVRDHMTDHIDHGNGGWPG